MTQEEKELLLRDISARLQSGLKVCCINLSDEMPKVWDLIGMPAPHLADILVEGLHRFAAVNIEESIRPYLRPLSSMTEEEKKKLWEELDKDTEILCENIDAQVINVYKGRCYRGNPAYHEIDFLNRNMFDWRGLIPMGLAIEAPENLYKN